MRTALQRILLAPVAAGGAVTPATFVGEAVHGFQAATDTFDYSGTSAASGDYMLILASGGDAGTTPTFSINGTSVPLISSDVWLAGYTSRLFGRLLGAGDIGHVLDISGASTLHGCQVSVYRGLTTATNKVFATAASGSATIVLSGFAPNGSSKGVVAMLENNAATFDPASSGWTDRGGGALAAAGGTFLSDRTLDKLSGYTNASVTFTESGTSEKTGWLIEFT